MDNTTLEKMAVTAFDNLQKTRLNLFTAAEHTLTVKQDLEDAKTQAQIGGRLVVGTVLGGRGREK